MEFIKTEIKNLFIIKNYNFIDNRGSFNKTFSFDEFRSFGINFIPKEIYYSISKKNVIRGMHFQTPPAEHSKLVSVINGKVLDVVLDLRKNSGTYGKAISVILKANENSIFIPIGCAHGFKSLENNSFVLYCQTSCYSKENDSGILWNSFGFDWEIENPILSERDLSFIDFNKFISPF